MATYTVQDTTMTALGDAIRSKVIGQSEAPVPISNNWVMTYSIQNRYFEFPTFVKKIKLIGSVDYRSFTGSSVPPNGLQGLGITTGVYLNSFQARDSEDFIIINEGVGFDEATNEPIEDYNFDFEIVIEGNSGTFACNTNSSSPSPLNLNFTAIGLDENGNEFKYTPAEMVEKIDGLATVPMEAFYVTGSCNFRFAHETLDWLINLYGDRVITEDITNATYMFSDSSVEYIPFNINFKLNTTHSIDSMFSGAEYLKELPIINNIKPSAMTQTFYQLFRIRYIAEDVADNWDLEYMNNSTASSAYFFNSAFSLRKIPKWHQRCWSKNTSSYSGSYNGRYGSCYALDEVKDLPVVTATFTSNTFSGFCSSTWRVKDITFMLNEDGTTQTANWKNQTIDLSSNIGYFNKSYLNYLIDEYNSGITEDKRVIDDATYEALKNDPDWFTTDINYSRYNHDSAVNTINSLPDCSSSGGTNTIKFKGAAGALTDGGAINTLTEEEIAVASAKGWTVSLV